MTIIALLHVGHNTIASPLPYQSINMMSTDPVTGLYRHHTDSNPHIDAVYDNVWLRKPYIKQKREIENATPINS